MTCHSAYSQNLVPRLEDKTARKESLGKHHDVIEWMSNGAVWLSSNCFGLTLSGSQSVGLSELGLLRLPVWYNMAPARGIYPE